MEDSNEPCPWLDAGHCPCGYHHRVRKNTVQRNLRMLSGTTAWKAILGLLERRSSQPFAFTNSLTFFISHLCFWSEGCTWQWVWQLNVQKTAPFLLFFSSASWYFQTLPLAVLQEILNFPSVFTIHALLMILQVLAKCTLSACCHCLVASRLYLIFPLRPLCYCVHFFCRTSSIWTTKCSSLSFSWWLTQIFPNLN